MPESPRMRWPFTRLALLPAALLLAVFVWGGNQPEAAGLIPAPWDKLAHLAWFALLAGLLALGSGRRWTWAVVGFCIAVAVWDEWRQFTLPGRAPAWDDLLADMLGIGIGVLCAARVLAAMAKGRDRPGAVGPGA